MEGVARPGGELALSVIRGRGIDVRSIARDGLPGRHVPRHVSEWRARNRPHLMRGARRLLAARAFGQRPLTGALWLTLLRDGEPVDLGLASLRVVTTAGVNAIRDAFLNTFELETFNFHGLGTGATAEAVGDTALQTELTTAYNPNNTRATGVQSSGGAGIYRTVATNTVDAVAAVTEHGILSQAATGGGTLLDRSVFAVVNLGIGDGLQSTYEISFPAGG